MNADAVQPATHSHKVPMARDEGSYKLLNRIVNATSRSSNTSLSDITAGQIAPSPWFTSPRTESGCVEFVWQA
jgi:hypothetical protein